MCLSGIGFSLLWWENGLRKARTPSPVAWESFEHIQHPSSNMFQCITLTHLGDSQGWGGGGRRVLLKFQKICMELSQHPTSNSLFYRKAAYGGPVHVSSQTKCTFFSPSSSLAFASSLSEFFPRIQYLEGLLSLKKTTQSAYSLWSVGNSIQPVFMFRGDEHFTQRNDSLMVKFLVLSWELMGLSRAFKSYNTGDYWWWGHRSMILRLPSLTRGW